MLCSFRQGGFKKHRQYTGHSAHVTNIKWTYDDSMVVTTGGADTSIIVWHVRKVVLKDQKDGEEPTTEFLDDVYDDLPEEGDDLTRANNYHTSMYLLNIRNSIKWICLSIFLFNLEATYTRYYYASKYTVYIWYQKIHAMRKFVCFFHLSVFSLSLLLLYRCSSLFHLI